MNPASMRRLAQVHPDLRRAVLAMAAALLEAHELKIEVVQGLRTIAEQDALYAKGRTIPGPIVTRAKGGESNHNYGLAVDVCPFVEGKPWWTAPLTIWMQIGDAAREHGLAWGGDWQKFIDKPHVEIPGLSVKRCQALYAAQGLTGVWDVAGARRT